MIRYEWCFVAHLQKDPCKKAVISRMVIDMMFGSIEVEKEFTHMLSIGTIVFDLG